MNLPSRPKRLRKNKNIRALLKQTHLRIDNIIAPLFISEALTQKKTIASMPGQYQYSLDDLEEVIAELTLLGINAVLLFGIPKHKDAKGTASLRQDGIVQLAIQRIKQINPEMTVIADVCLCEYTNHGHCGLLKGESIDNDATLLQLAAQAVSYADAGADWVAPSSMTDGMVAAIRQALDEHHHQDTAILSYAVKYSSGLYGPFREAAEGAPKFGDRKSYQMDFANASEALREAALDVAEGADMLMVKPAMLYLDIIKSLKEHHPSIPLCAYQVSGEYAMIKCAAEQGLIHETDVMIESLTAIQRAGADLIITYFAKQLATVLKS